MFSGELAPSVLILRVPHGRVDDVVEQVLAVWKDVEPALRDGAIVVASPGALRIRPLHGDEPKR